MARNKNSAILIVSLLLASLSLAHAQTNQNKNGFFERGAEGWFWYEDPPEPPKKEEIIPPPPPPTVIPPPEPPPEIIEEEEPKPLAFSTEWLRINLPKYLDIATDEPTLENVSNYLYLQRLAMDKAEQFAQASQMAVVGNPFLDESTRRPFATFAAQDLDRKAGVRSDEMLKKVGERAGLFFFFDHSEGSMFQLPLIEALIKATGIPIVAISVDGIELPNNPLKDVRLDQGQAEMLNIQAYPAIFLVTMDGTFSSIAQTIISLEELKQRILVVANRENVITDTEFKTTKPLFDIDNNMVDIFDYIRNTKGANLPVNASKKDGFVEPSELYQLIRQHTLGR